MVRRSLLFGLIIVLLTAGLWAQAQQAVVTQMSAEARTILNDVNRARIRTNLAPLVPNPILNEIAAFIARDLSARAEISNRYITDETNQDLTALINAFGYPVYTDVNPGIFDFAPIRLVGVLPGEFVQYWINDSRGSRQLLSLRLSTPDSVESILPMFSPRYREIGVGYLFDAVNNRHSYVLVFASQPGVLPASVVERGAPNVLSEVVTTREVVLFVPDERIRTSPIIGSVRALRVSESPEAQPCPLPPLAVPWQPYQNQILYTLSNGAGLKKIFVQLCDDGGKTVTSEVNVIYQPPGVTLSPGGTAFPTPDVNAIANATQTAAASATAFAPYERTVVAILTATASAP